MITYLPKHHMPPLKIAPVPTAWAEVVPVVESILDTFHVERDVALEFGVDHGYSTSVLANFFRHVIGVDHFEGDVHSGFRPDEMFAFVKNDLKDFPNIALVPLAYQDFISDWDCDFDFDFIHIDIVHTYPETFECGEWAVQHAPVVMFHDTLAFPEVMRAVKNIATKHDLVFYHVPEQHGIGILIRKEK